MDIINCSLNTHIYYNISIDLHPLHSTISCNFFRSTIQNTAIEMLAIYCVNKMRLFAAFFDINASRFLKFFLTSCRMR